MKVRRVRPQVLEVTLHVLELSALVSAARWALDDAQGELPPEAREQLRRVLDDYAGELAKLDI